MASLDNEDLPFTRAFNKMVDQVLHLSVSDPSVIIDEIKQKRGVEKVYERM